MIRVLIADDSKVVREALSAVIDLTDDIKVVGCAQNGQEAIQMANDLKPSLITMDAMMPDIDGFVATRMIMQQTPTPIIMVSNYANDKDMDMAFRAIEEGALSVIEKPKNLFDEQSNDCNRLIETIRYMSEVKVVRRRRVKSESPVDFSLPNHARIAIVALACSTGGPITLKSILSRLPQEFPVPIVIAQHITDGFLAGLIDWLQKYCALTVKQVEHKEYLTNGVVYFVPTTHQLSITTDIKGFQCQLELPKSTDIYSPSANHLFHSIAKCCNGNALCGVLTGMGDDGASGLLAISQTHSITFAQNQESSTVFGMPARAIELQACQHVLDLSQIANFITDMTCIHKQ